MCLRNTHTRTQVWQLKLVASIEHDSKLDFNIHTTNILYAEGANART